MTSDRIDHTDQAALSALARELLRTWMEHPAEFVLVRGFRQRQAVVALVYGLAAHAHYIGTTAIDLLDEGRTLTAIPLVRCMYECGITSQWAMQVSDGAEAFVGRRRVRTPHGAGCLALAKRSPRCPTSTRIQRGAGAWSAHILPTYKPEARSDVLRSSH